MIPRHAHKRSLSSEHRALSPDKTVHKAKSTTNLTEIAAKNGSIPKFSKFEENNFNTLQDPRLATPTEVSDEDPSAQHPDLSNEVAALSVKLIQAINNQTQLDDSLVAARQELELAQGKIQALEFQNEKYRRDIEERIYIKRSDAEYEIGQMAAVLAEERTKRQVAEKGKKQMEQELEALTADLFEEANKMVAAVKRDREATEKKNEQLRSQVKDTELLLASHQDQLAELKSVMQGMQLTKDEVEPRTTPSTAPPSPIGASHLQGHAKQDSEVHGTAAIPCNPDEQIPGPSCNFPEIVRLVCRNDLPAYDDFQELLGADRMGGLNVMSLAGFASNAISNNYSPTKGANHSPNGSLNSTTGSHIPLKDTKFYKRVLMEDIEPTLRLDLSLGISWLTRRSVLSGICDGSLVVEPMPAATKKYEFPCTVCGERRAGANNERTHRFRTSDSETAQRYSLCQQCLERFRACCDFTGYLRLILDGHLRAGDADEERDIWEETVRLRERLFWSRVAGGIVPLVSRVAEADTDHENSEPNSDGFAPSEARDGLLHPEANHIAESRSEDVTVRSERDSSVFAPSLPDLDLRKPSTPEPHQRTEDLNSDLPPRRASVDSEISVYEEANDDMETEPVEVTVEVVSPVMLSPTEIPADVSIEHPTESAESLWANCTPST
ncbi:hypothetical protein N7470_004938 [Penicillium chermesinum]|nr:hypothetical protein N7470_004938 [Penicillium chermesinum]